MFGDSPVGTQPFPASGMTPRKPGAIARRRRKCRVCQSAPAAMAAVEFCFARSPAGQGLKSICWLLKGRKVLFTDPTARVKIAFLRAPTARGNARSPDPGPAPPRRNSPWYANAPRHDLSRRSRAGGSHSRRRGAFRTRGVTGPVRLRRQSARSGRTSGGIPNRCPRWRVFSLSSSSACRASSDRRSACRFSPLLTYRAMRCWWVSSAR